MRRNLLSSHFILNKYSIKNKNLHKMIPKFRIGKDLNIRWQILVNGQIQDLSNADLSIILRDPSGKSVEITVFSVNNNIISFCLRGTSFHALGTYMLTLWMNKGKKAQTMLDKREAFALVRYTDQEEESDDNIIITDSSLNLTGNLSYIISDTSGGIPDDYVTEDQLEEILDDFVIQEELDAVLEDFVMYNDISTMCTTNDISTFATTDDISIFTTKNDISNFIEEDNLPENIVEKQDISAFITRQDVSNCITEIKTINGQSLIGTGNIVISSDTPIQPLVAGDHINITNNTISVTGMPTKTSDLTNDSGFIQLIPPEYVTKSQLNSSLSDFYNKTYIDSKFDLYVTKTALNSSLSNYYTKSEMNASLGNFYTKTWLNNKFNSYYTKTEIDEVLGDIQNLLESI